LFAADGFKLPDDIESALEQQMIDQLSASPSGAVESGPDDIGKAVRIDDAAGRYVQFLKDVFPKELTLDGMKIVVDCANGAAYQVAPQVFEELGADVIAMGVEPNGRNINDGCGAMAPAKMAAEVVRQGAALGIALDGDADRLILVDEKGKVVDGDQIMALLGRRMLAAGTLPGRTVVATVMSNLGLERALAREGGKLLRTAVGDRYVVEAMRQGGFRLGGEQSGHVVFLDHATTGDGTLAALKVLAVMVQVGRPLSELAESSMVRYPQVLLNFAVREKKPLEELPDVGRAISQVEKVLGPEGRVLVRYSGTESKVRVMIEGQSEPEIRAHAEEIAGVLKRCLGS
jgi:phosphoglucosamine mutase